MARTVLIIHPGALGDILLALPAIRSIRNSFPRHDVVLLAQASAARLLLSCKEVDQIEFTEGSVLTSLTAGMNVYEEVPPWLLHCDLAIAWVNDVQGGLQATFSQFGIPHLVTSPHLREYLCMHALGVPFDVRLGARSRQRRRRRRWRLSRWAAAGCRGFMSSG